MGSGSHSTPWGGRLLLAAGTVFSAGGALEVRSTELMAADQCCKLEGGVTARVVLCFSLGLVGIGVQTAGREVATCFNSRWWYDLVLGWLGLKAAPLNGTSVAQLA